MALLPPAFTPLAGASLTSASATAVPVSASFAATHHAYLQAQQQRGRLATTEGLPDGAQTLKDILKVEPLPDAAAARLVPAASAVVSSLMIVRPSVEDWLKTTTPVAISSTSSGGAAVKKSFTPSPASKRRRPRGHDGEEDAEEEDPVHRLLHQQHLVQAAASQHQLAPFPAAQPLFTVLRDSSKHFRELVLRTRANVQHKTNEFLQGSVLGAGCGPASPLSREHDPTEKAAQLEGTTASVDSAAASAIVGWVRAAGPGMVVVAPQQTTSGDAAVSTTHWGGAAAPVTLVQVRRHLVSRVQGEYLPPGVEAAESAITTTARAGAKSSANAAGAVGKESSKDATTTATRAGAAASRRKAADAAAAAPAAASGATAATPAATTSVTQSPSKAAKASPARKQQDVEAASAAAAATAKSPQRKGKEDEAAAAAADAATNDDDKEEEEDDDTIHWACCERCKRWRVLPHAIDPSASYFVCTLLPDGTTCTVPPETRKDLVALRNRRRAALEATKNAAVPGAS
jgi:hypothetical protein